MSVRVSFKSRYSARSFTICSVGLVFVSKYVQLRIMCSLQVSINMNSVEVDPTQNPYKMA